MQHPINKWPEQDRPREKLIEKGPQSLTDAELLAILINTGTAKSSALDLAKNLLKETGSLDKLARSSFIDLKKYNGIGPAKAVTLLSAVELSKRLHSALPEKKLVLKKPEEVFRYFGYRYSDEAQEIFSAVYLDTAGQVIKHVELTKGTVNQTVISAREIFRKAIELAATSIILIHNHPSGNCEPSKADIDLTKQLALSGEIIGIKVVDHVIIAGRKFSSLQELNLF